MLLKVLQIAMTARVIKFQTPSERGGIVLRYLVVDRWRARSMFQTPSERGGIVLITNTSSEIGGYVFQTPSERGGIVLE